MKTLTAILVLSAGIFLTQAHATATLRTSLTETDSVSGGRVALSEEAGVKRMMDSLQNPDAARATVKGQRITIFFDNKQDSRERSEEAAERFREHFPDVMVYTSYEIPYFRVMAGNCLNKEEAMMLIGRIRHVFPRAFIFNIDIPISEISRRPAVESPVADTTAVEAQTAAPMAE